ncbi:NAD-dependent epimerase/dehydratase family protein, partial [Alphaproteobacteria bacterium]|nr:NAD-dependent epimerase/dehydratase family protein [Alphaproteobacteria bacterium]
VDIEKTLLTTISSVKIFNKLKLKYFIFTSSPVIYGEVNKPINKYSKELPISNYGFSKLFSEKYILKAINKNSSVWIFRFPNVVGPLLTHGILFDFNIKLKKNNKYLKVLGNGQQKKPYLHVDDIIKGITIPIRKKLINKKFIYNLSPKDNGIEISKIAELFIKLKKLNIPIIYEGGIRGWEGDVPKYSYDYKDKQDIKWEPKFNSLSSIKKAIKDIL